MTPLLNYLTQHPLIGMVSATISAGATRALDADIIPNGVEEVTFYIASLAGAGIAVLSFVGYVRKEIEHYKSKRTKN